MASAGLTGLVLAACLLESACGEPRAPDSSATGAPAIRSEPRADRQPAAAPAAALPDGQPGGQPDLPPLAYESALPEPLRELIDRPFTGDLDGMEQRRLIRVGVAVNRTHYFVDRGTQRGLTFEYLTRFQDALNAARKTRHLRIHVVPVPLSRDRLLPALTEGRIDAIAAQWTITPERRELVDFSAPMRRNVSEIVVSAPNGPAVSVAEDLAGREVVVRRSSSYHASLRELNARLEGAGKPPVIILDAPETLEDDDLLEMANAGLIGATVVDDYLAQFWSQVFTEMILHPSAVVRAGGDLAIAFRRNSPKLEAEANAFIRGHGIGTVFGNTVTTRYLQHTRFARPATTGAARQKFLAMQDLFRKYGERYQLDYLLMMAKGYQESRLNQSVRSPVGAIGVMQIMPATGRSLGVGDITQLEPNIHAGVKYTRRLMDHYLRDEPLDELNKGLFTLASYNAGPTRVRQLRREAGRRSLDPDTWFGQVERIAAERIGRETVSYVSSIYKYYVAYRLVAEEQQRRAIHRSKLKGAASAALHRPDHAMSR